LDGSQAAHVSKTADGLEEVAGWIAGARTIVGFTGAGISTESGIPDFRSPGGVWARNRTVTYQEFVASHEERVEYWRQKCESWAEMRLAEPNAGHRAFVELERAGKLSAMITQNIDGLHQRAGLPSSRVLEIHGTTVEVACLTEGCGYRVHSDVACKWVADGDLAPECPECGGHLKPATISFGQAMPREVLAEAERRSRSCDLFLCVGSSLVVQPAALLPLIAKQSGARLVLINREATPLDEAADALLHGEIGSILPRLVASALDRQVDEA